MKAASGNKAPGVDISQLFPQLDTDSIEYLKGLIDLALENVSKGLDVFDPVEDIVNELLGQDEKKKAGLEQLLQTYSKLLKDKKSAYVRSNKNTASGVSGLEELPAPIKMAEFSKDVQKLSRLGQTGKVNLTHAKGKYMESQVDTKKLLKAEAKIAAKLQKKEMKSMYEASKLIEIDNLMDDDLLLQQVNPIVDYTSTKGKVKDVKLENFDISFAGKRILTGANLTLAFGRRYGLIGRNGIGKSTLLRNMSLRELNVPTFISILHVEQEMRGDDTPAIESVLKADFFRERLLAEERKVQTRMRNLDIEAPESEEDKARVEDEKNECGEQLNHVMEKLQEIESDKAESKAGAILSGLGFSAPQFKHATKTFSGGWRMRLSLARALFCKPDLLLLDEPTNMLDIPAVAWLEQYLQTWPNTLLVVSHDREFLDYVATDIIHFQSEKLDAYRGNFTQFWATREERIKMQMREYDAQQQYIKHLQDFIDKWRYNAKRAPQAQSKIKILEKLPRIEKPESEKLVNFRFPDPEKLSPPILYMDNVTFRYSPDSPAILSNIAIDMQMRTRVAVAGPNGAGKTTMLKLLIGSLEPNSGTVHRHGRLRIAYFAQHHVDQLTMNVTCVSHMANTFPGHPEEEYRRALGAFGITGMTGLQKISTLSGGQKSRVAFACLAMQSPHFLVLDEPTNHLDMDSIDALTRALKEFTGGVIIVSHDERFIDAVTDELWVCDRGSLTKFAGDGIKAYKKSLEI